MALHALTLLLLMKQTMTKTFDHVLASGRSTIVLHALLWATIFVARCEQVCWLHNMWLL